MKGLALALGNLDLVIKIIRGSEDPKEAKARLVAEVSMPGRALEKFIGQKLGDEKGEAFGRDRPRRDSGAGDSRHAPAAPDGTRARENRRGIPRGPRPDRAAEGNPRLRKARARHHRRGAEGIKKTFGKRRRTEIVAEATEIGVEDLIAEEEMVITVSRGGYIKRSPLSLYRAQRRGGKGRIGATTKEEDVVEHLFAASTHAFILAFTSQGRMHWIKVYDLPQLGSGHAGEGDRQFAAI